MTSEIIHLGRVEDWVEVPLIFRVHVRKKLAGICYVNHNRDSEGREILTCTTCEISWEPSQETV